MDLLALEGIKVGRKHVATLMKRVFGVSVKTIFGVSVKAIAAV
jgi:hypothetical protein